MLAGKLYLDGHRKKSSNVERPNKKESHKSLVKYLNDQIALSRAIFSNAQIFNQLITNMLDHLNYRSFSGARMLRQLCGSSTARLDIWFGLIVREQNIQFFMVIPVKKLSKREPTSMLKT